MINKIIAFSVRNKLVIGLFTLLLIGWGVYSVTQISINAVPDITNNQVQVITVSQNLAAQEVEQFITQPVELSLNNLPGVKEIRSISRFGLSVITVVFEEKMGIYKPRQLVSEKLKEAQEEIFFKKGNDFAYALHNGFDGAFLNLYKVDILGVSWCRVQI